MPVSLTHSLARSFLFGGESAHVFSIDLSESDDFHGSLAAELRLQEVDQEHEREASGLHEHEHDEPEKALAEKIVTVPVELLGEDHGISSELLEHQCHHCVAKREDVLHGQLLPRDEQLVEEQLDHENRDRCPETRHEGNVAEACHFGVVVGIVVVATIFIGDERGAQALLLAFIALAGELVEFANLTLVHAIAEDLEHNWGGQDQGRRKRVSKECDAPSLRFFVLGQLHLAHILCLNRAIFQFFVA